MEELLIRYHEGDPMSEQDLSDEMDKYNSARAQDQQAQDQRSQDQRAQDQRAQDQHEVAVEFGLLIVSLLSLCVWGYYSF